MHNHVDISPSTGIASHHHLFEKSLTPKKSPLKKTGDKIEGFNAAGFEQNSTYQPSLRLVAVSDSSYREATVSGPKKRQGTV